MAETLKFGGGIWAVKEGSTLAYNDENGNYKPLPFTFDRSTSATRVNKQGLIEVVPNNEPRIDFLNDSKGALLLEPSRTNLITYSQEVSNWSIISSGIVITDNTTDVLSPSGKNDASKVEFNSASKILGQSPTLSGNYSGFIYVKGTQGETIRFNFGGTEENFTLTGGWDKLERTNITATANAFNLNTFTGVTARTIYLWGAQLEQGSYATSYIPTQGGIGTRVAESCEQTVPDGIIGQTEGTIFAEFEYFGNTFGALEISPIYIGSGTYANAIYADIYQGKLYAVCFNNGVNQASINCGVLSVGTHKVAIGYSNNDIVIYIDGLLGGSDTSATIPNCNIVYLGTVGTSTSVQKYTQSKAQLYNTRLSNTELQALTKI